MRVGDVPGTQRHREAPPFAAHGDGEALVDGYLPVTVMVVKDGPIGA
jgi:hypothetical protein